MRGKIAPLCGIRPNPHSGGRDFGLERKAAYAKHPDFPQADEMVECTFFDRIELVERGPSGIPLAKQAKLHKNAKSDYVLCLDADTYFMGDVTNVVQTLANHNLAAAFDTWQIADIYRKHNSGLPLVDPLDFSPFFNGGVLFLRRDRRTLDFLERCRTKYANDNRITLDQLVFRENLCQANIRLHRPCYVRSNAWTSSSAFVADFLNSVTENRVFHASRRTACAAQTGLYD
jgi:Nucleotide-diphospho-sugar transferase